MRVPIRPPSPRLKTVEPEIRSRVASRGYSVTALHLYQFVHDTCHLGSIEASLQDLANHYLVSVTTMRRIIRQAEELEMVIVEERSTLQGAALANVYRPHPKLVGRNVVENRMASPMSSLPPTGQTQDEDERTIYHDGPEATPPRPVPSKEPPLPPPTPAPPRAPDLPAKLAAWLEQRRESLHLEGHDADKILEVAHAYGIEEQAFDELVRKIRVTPAYWYPGAIVRSIIHGGLTGPAEAMDSEARAQAIRVLVQTAASRRQVPPTQTLVLIYKKLETAGLDHLATGEEVQEWRKGRRILNKKKE